MDFFETARAAARTAVARTAADQALVRRVAAEIRADGGLPLHLQEAAAAADQLLQPVEAASAWTTADGQEITSTQVDAILVIRTAYGQVYP